VWLWRHTTNVWKLRTTTQVKVRKFTGGIVGTTGPIVGLRATRNELADRVVLKGNQVAFNFSTKGDVDGFDFVTEKNSCIKVNLVLEKDMPIDRIFLGRKQYQPKNTRFVVCP
jgi:hypothetical protein